MNRNLSTEQHWTIARLAHWYLERGRARQAETLARGLIALDPRDGTGWMYYGEARWLQEDLDEALRGLEQAAGLLDGRPRLWMRLGGGYLSLGRYEEAEKALKKARALCDDGALRRRVEALLRRCPAI